MLAQTPQVFRYDLLMRAFADRARATASPAPTNPAWWSGWTVEVSVVLGSDRNIKITRPGDMDLARLFLQRRNRQGNRSLSEIRTGLGWDVHRLAAGRAADSGRRRRSHANSDWKAIPTPTFWRTPSPTPFWARPRWATSGCTSRIPTRAGKAATAWCFCGTPANWREGRGYRLVNVDSTVILERPKLKDYRQAIRERLADDPGPGRRPRFREIQDGGKGGAGGRGPFGRGAGGGDAGTCRRRGIGQSPGRYGCRFEILAEPGWRTVKAF